MTGTRMLEEIHEQPDVLRELCRRALEEWRIPKSLFRGISSVVIVGSGSSFNAGLLTRLYLETVAELPARVDPASEAFRYPVPDRPLAIGLSHSGSSADVRAALKRARQQGCRTLALTNIEGSPLTREADAALVTGAGVERAVPSTKGFTALVAASLLLAAYRADALTSSASAVTRAARVIENGSGVSVDAIAERVASSKTVVFLGEGLLYAVARDAALKLLEVTYIPALAYPPDEFRHGPIALAEPGVTIVALTRLSRAVAKSARASGAFVIELPPLARVPRVARPLVRAVELQLLAHAVGTLLGRDIDNPRALSKVVR
jgi:glucosamine--fructose-6-phosphate aminotransferase (isomerizing)